VATAESVYILGRIHFRDGEFVESKKYLGLALHMRRQIYGFEHICTAEVLEALALTLLHLEYGVGVSGSAEEIEGMAPTAAEDKSFRAPPKQELEEKSRGSAALAGGEDEENKEGVDAMLFKALEIRETKQGRSHPQVAHCQLKICEWFFARASYEEAIPRLLSAIEIFTEHKTVKCKEVVQLWSWTAIAYMLLDDFSSATEWNTKAEVLVKKVFGAESWEAHRIMIDQVAILQHSFAEDDDKDKDKDKEDEKDDDKEGERKEGERKAKQKKEKKDKVGQSSEARKAFAMAERVETRANALEKALKKNGAADKALPLCVFAVKRRNLLHSSFKQAGLGGGRRSVAQADDGAADEPTAARQKSDNRASRASKVDKPVDEAVKPLDVAAGVQPSPRQGSQKDGLVAGDNEKKPSPRTMKRGNTMSGKTMGLPAAS